MLPQQPRLEVLPSSQHGVKAATFHKPCVDFHWHFHPEVELVWIENGEGILHAGRAIYPYQSGQLVMLGANLPHAYGSAPSQRTGAQWSVLHFRPLIWGDAFWNLPENRRIRNLIVQAECGYIFTGKTARACAEYIRRIEIREQRDMPIALLLQLLEELAVQRKRLRLNPNPIQGGKRAERDLRLARVLKMLEERLSDSTMAQGEVASWIHMSPQAFSRFFHRQSGRTFHQHLNELRVASACARLLGSEDSIAEIAFGAGFNNLSNFNRRFREITGRSPREYRKDRGGLLGK
ncbi:helix-turn-helix domain-containing protein [Cerasicoccus arenae]|uniref:helix-turn-helix domain-containing protein n=1 Tax=Cerasicoccus arenae TaxID=424488 RepID=UPI001674D855|nr:AraC family transcriptional regulator [Cerasicoccus arenae]MBK1858846.1 helix-turn-helix domain-containing protein [Cerasicoccus arenae]